MSEFKGILEEITEAPKKRMIDPDFLKTFDGELLSFETDDSDSPKEIRRGAMVRDYVANAYGVEPDGEDQYRLMRDRLASGEFNGVGVGDNDAFFGELSKKAGERKEAFDFYEKLDRQATLSALLGGGQIELAFGKEAENSPVFQREKSSVVQRWKDSKDAVNEQYGDMIPQLRSVFKNMQNGGEWITEASRVAKDLDEEEKGQYLTVLRDLAMTYPTEEIEKGFKRLGLNLKKSGRGVSGAINAGAVGVGDLVRDGGTWHFAELFGSDEALYEAKDQQRRTAQWVKALRKENDFIADVRRVFEEDYDPIRPLAEKGTKLRAVEDGVYAIPGAVTTTAMAFIPAVGLPLTYGTIREFERQKYRGRLIANGVSREEAANIAEQISAISAFPQVLLEKMQANIVGGKSPLFSKILGKLDRVVAGKAKRFAGRFTLASTGETGIELLQELTSEVVQDLTHELNAHIPDVEWKNGEDGYLDGYFNKTITTFVAVAPLSIIPSMRGLSIDKRAAAVKTTSPLIRKAWGITEADNAAIDAAVTPGEQVQAVEQALENRDPQSESAKEGTDELDAQMQKVKESLKELEKLEAIPGVRTSNDSKGFVVYNSTTGETITNVDTTLEAAEAVFDDIGMTDKATQDHIDELVTMFKAGREIADKTGVEQKMELIRDMNIGKMAEMFDGVEERIGEQLKLKENIEEGSGEISRVVMQLTPIDGVNVPRGAQKNKTEFTMSFKNSSIFTLVHERAHSVRRELMRIGEVTRDEQIQFFRALNKNLKGRVTREGVAMEFAGIGEGNVSETALDEAWAEFSEVMLLKSRNGEKSGMRELLNKNLVAMIKNRTPGASKFKNFIRAMREFFGLNLSRAAALDKAERDGNLDPAEMERFRAMVMGETAQDQYEREVVEKFEENGQKKDTGSSFSISTVEANKFVSKTVYLKNQDKFQKAIDNGTIETGVDVFKFEGKDVFLHAPDFAFAGETEVAGEVIAEGKGGVYYPILFSAANYFWASTKNAAKGMAETLNDIGRRNGGKILMALSSSPADKMFSSTTISRGVVDFFGALTRNPRKFGITKASLNRAIVQASKTKDVKGKTFKRKLFIKDGLSANTESIKEMLNPEDSSFGLRKKFSESLANEVVMILGNTVSEQSSAVAGALLGKGNIHAKGSIQKGKLSKSAIIQALGEKFSEEFTKQSLHLESGSIYAVIEFDGEVEAVESAEHESYPFAIVGKGDNKVKVNVLEKAHNWRDMVAYSENVEFKKEGKVVETAKKGDAVSENRRDSVMPPSAGVSMKPLTITKNKGIGEGIELSFSISRAQDADNKGRLRRTKEQKIPAFKQALIPLESSLNKLNKRKKKWEDIAENSSDGKKRSQAKGELKTLDLKITRSEKELSSIRAKFDGPAGIFSFYSWRADDISRYIDISDSVAFLESLLKENGVAFKKEKSTKSEATYIYVRADTGENKTDIKNSVKVRISNHSNAYPGPDVQIGARDHGFLSMEEGLDSLFDLINRPDLKEKATDAINSVLEDGLETSFSITRAQDTTYLAAVGSGDMEAAQEMVDEAAKAAGYGKRHRQRNPDFKNKKENAQFVNGEEIHNSYGDHQFVTKDLTEIPEWLYEMSEEHFGDRDQVNPVDIVDAALAWDDLDFVSEVWLEMENRGLDGEVVGFETEDGGVVIDPWSAVENGIVKSADPVTYDESGEVIPLSERFNEQDDRISYSLGNSSITDSIISDVTQRVRAPEARATMFSNIAQRVERLKTETRILQQKAIDASTEEQRDEIKAIQVEIDALDQAYDFDLEILTKEFEADKAYIGEDIVAQFAHRIEVATGKDKASLTKEAKARESERMKAARQRFADAKKLAKSKIATEKAELKTSRTAIEGKLKESALKSLTKDIRESLVMLDAVLMAIPIELRGKVGGFAQLAKLNTEEKRLEFLLKRMDKLDHVVETWIREQYQKQIKKLFVRAKPKKTEKGVPKSKLAAEYTDRVLEIERLSKLGKADVDTLLTENESAIAKATDQEEIDRHVGEMVELMAFGHINGMNAQALESFFRNLNSVVETGKMLKDFADEAFRNEANGIKEIVNHDVTGGAGPVTSPESKKKAKERKAIVVPGHLIGAEDVELESLSDFHRKNISFEWLLNNLARANKSVGTLASKTHDTLARMVHVASHAEKRSNMAMQKRYQEKLSSILGVKPGLKLSEAISDKLEAEVEQTGVMRIDYKGQGAFSKKKARASNIESVINGDTDIDALGLNAEEWKSAKARYDEIVAKSKNGKVKGSRVIEYQSPNVGTPTNLTLSQSQAINLTMLFRQEGLKESMIHEGYSEEAMNQMESFLSPEAKAIRAWFTNEYAENYHVINDVFKPQNGVSLPQTDFYSPARRLAEGKVNDLAIDSAGTSAMSTNPNFTISRTKNFAEVDQTASALAIYMQHMVQTSHYVHWANPTKMLRTVFSDKTVKQNIADYAGRDLLNTISERIEWMADGGNRKATHIRWLDGLRATHTYASLAYNWGVAIKQLTSLPAYAFDMSFKDFGKYAAKFMAHPVKNFQEMADTEYVKTRFKEGYERDVIDGLKKEGGVIMKGLQLGMLFGKAGDIVPVMIGGWMARQRSYDMNISKMSEEEAMKRATIDFEMITDRAQQAGDLKDLSSFQGGGSIFKLFTMYKTSPRQYYANLYESMLDAKAGKKGAASEFGRRLLVAQIILPLSFQFVSDVLRSPFSDDDDTFEPENYLRAVLMGPLNGLFIGGDFAELGFSALAGAKVWDEKIPIMDGFTKAMKANTHIRAGEWGEAIDEAARGIGKTTVSVFTYYDILRKELKRFDIGD